MNLQAEAQGRFRRTLATLSCLLLALNIGPAQEPRAHAFPAEAMADQPPTASISAPAPGTRYRGGQKISYAGSATDPESGGLPARVLSWQVDFHHGTQVTPLLAPTSGVICGSFTVPRTGYAGIDAFYRISLSATD